jgi:hypothetical protein
MKSYSFSNFVRDIQRSELEVQSDGTIWLVCDNERVIGIVPMINSRTKTIAAFIRGNNKSPECENTHRFMNIVIPYDFPELSNTKSFANIIDLLRNQLLREDYRLLLVGNSGMFIKQTGRKISYVIGNTDVVNFYTHDDELELSPENGYITTIVYRGIQFHVQVPLIKDKNWDGSQAASLLYGLLPQIHKEIVAFK